MRECEVAFHAEHRLQLRDRRASAPVTTAVAPSRRPASNGSAPRKRNADARGATCKLVRPNSTPRPDPEAAHPEWEQDLPVLFAHPEILMGKYFLAWLLGVPAFVLVILYLFFH